MWGHTRGRSIGFYKNGTKSRPYLCKSLGNSELEDAFVSEGLTNGADWLSRKYFYKISHLGLESSHATLLIPQRLRAEGDAFASEGLTNGADW